MLSSPPPAGGDARGGDSCQHFSLALHAEVEGHEDRGAQSGGRLLPGLTPFSVTGPRKELNSELREKLVAFVQTLGISRDHTAFCPKAALGGLRQLGRGTGG